MYLCVFACSWRVDEELFENFQEQDFEVTEQQQETEGKYIPWSTFILITFIDITIACINLMGPTLSIFDILALESRVI
jgi:hypothetical protein